MLTLTRPKGVGSWHGKYGIQRTFDDSTIHPDISDYLANAATTIFGKENWGEKGAVLEEWTGIMGTTVDYHPFVGVAPDQEGLWVCAGFNGHGESIAVLWGLETDISRYGTRISVCGGAGRAYYGHGEGG